jgi:flagellar biosynthesis/type III secretory pathway M-ring protein FliF/YscJ
MKSRKVRGIVGAILILSMLFGAGFAISQAKLNNHPQIVLAEDAEEGEQQETPSETPEETSEEGESEETPEEEKEDTPTYETKELNKENILEALKNTFKDAWDDFVKFIKEFFAKK